MGKMIALLLYIATAILSAPATPCVATWYDMHGSRTASGTRMHRDSLTAAYNHVALGTRLEIRNVTTSACCTVRVTDRMGVKSPNRIDLSYAAFGHIAPHSQGKAHVTVTPIK